MYFKALVLVLALLFLQKGYNAKVINTLDEQEDETSMIEEIMKDDDENTKVDTRRDLGHKTKSFSDASLELAKLHILEEIVKKSKDITNENSEDKCSKIKKVGEPIVHHGSGITQGAWMKDPLGLLGPEKIWYINGYYTNKVLKFESMDHFKAGEVAKTYILPYYIDGTGSVVYGRHLYFNRKNSSNVVQYDLVTEKIRETRLNIIPRKYQYEWGGYTTMDFSVDETGLWVLYSHLRYKGRLCATLLDPLTLSAVHSYCGISSEPMTSMGNAFVACGIVYSIDSYNSRTTTINYAYDTATGSRTNPGIKFVNKFRYNSMVTYNPREKVLYAWDNRRQITYPLEFED